MEHQTMAQCTICHYVYHVSRNHCPTCGAIPLEHAVNRSYAVDVATAFLMARASNMLRDWQDVREAERYFQTEEN